MARDLIRQVPESHQVIGRTSNDVDIADADAVARTIRDVQPGAIINAAAYTDVDGAEREAERAFAVNGAAPGFIGAAAQAADIPVVHFSTDYVFDGASRNPYCEDDETSPIGVYGSSKLQGENRLIDSGVQSMIIRTQWLFGVGGESFPATMWHRATSGQRTRVVDDQTGRPTYTVDLARATWGLLTGRRADGQTGRREARDSLEQLGAV